MKIGFLIRAWALTKSERRLLAMAMAAAFALTASVQSSPAQPTTGPQLPGPQAAGQQTPPNNSLQGSYARGKDLFTGQTAFRNGGLACISCHSAGGLSFPNGGTLGPDLTGTYSKLGDAGTEAAMQTLYFPTMIPIYRDHQLTPQEQADMVAFFRQTATEAPPQAQKTTGIVILLAFVGGIILVVLTAFLWRKRVLSVRRALVARATQRGARL